MIDQNHIIELLGTGLDQNTVARAVGCDPAYITQLMAQEDFAAKVIVLRTKNLTANTERDKKIDTIEDTLLEKLKDLIESNQIYKPRDILAAWTVVNKAIRRGVPATEAITMQQTVVSLQIPTTVIANFVTNPNGEVVEAQGKTLVTMSSSSLLQKLANERGVEGSKYADLKKFLPPAIETGVGD